MKDLIRRCIKGFGLCITAIFLLTIFSGCVTKEARKDVSDEEDILRQRIVEYWDYRLKGEFDRAYEYEYIPNVPRMRYITMYSNNLMNLESYEIQSIKMQGNDMADVEMGVAVLVKAPGARAFEHKSTIKERWLKMRGTWYHVNPLSKGPLPNN